MVPFLSVRDRDGSGGGRIGTHAPGHDNDAQRRPQNGSRGGTFRSNPDRQRGERRRLSARRLPVERRPGGRSPTADPLAVEVGEPVAPGARRSSPSARAPSRPRRRATGRIGSLECPGHSLTAVIGRRWTLVGHVAGSVGVGRATQPRRAPATVRHRPRSATAAGSPPPARLRREQSCGVAPLGALPGGSGRDVRSPLVPPGLQIGAWPNCRACTPKTVDRP